MASGSQSLNIGSDGIYNNDCEVCLSNNRISEAISFCKICCEHLCKSCDMAHRGSKATKDHTLLTGSNIPSGSTRVKPTIPFLFCDTHKTSLLDIYCTTHDEVLCQVCKMTLHKTCHTGDVSRHSANIDVGREFRKVANRLTDLSLRYDRLTKNRQTDKSTVMSQIQKGLSEMQQFRRDMNDKLDSLERKLSREIRQFEITMKQEIDGHVTLAYEISHQIKDLERSLSECEKRRENDVMFVGLKKASSRTREYSHSVGKIEKEIHPIDIRFQPNGVLSDMIQQLQSMGTVANILPITSGPIQTSILNISVTEKRAIDHELPDGVLGCTFMPDGHLVLACGNDGLKLFDENFLFKTQLPVFSVDVSSINDTDVIVTQYEDKQLQRVRIFPKMEVKKTLKMDRLCEGVDVYGDEIYVTCHDNPGNGEVRVLDMDGNMVRRLGVDHDGEYMFTGPVRVNVNRDGTRIYVSDWDTDIVTCLNNQGHVIYEYSDTDLKSPSGMYVDGEDNLLVCEYNSNNVHMIRPDGAQEKILLAEKDGIHKPLCTSLRPSDGCLVVGLYPGAKTDQKLIIFSTR